MGMWTYVSMSVQRHNAVTLRCPATKEVSVAVRAVRGATQVERDDRDRVLAGAGELVAAVLERNAIDPVDLISVIFTATPDLTADFPAYAMRQLGITDVPLLCAKALGRASC